jgi:adenylate cyclase
VLIEFGSVVAAVECALALQQLAVERNRGIPDKRRMEWRIGVHLGDVLIEGDDILGDGVNIAARLEGIADPAASASLKMPFARSAARSRSSLLT